MKLLIETICLESGVPQRLELHNERLNRSRRELLGIKRSLNIEDYLYVPEEFKQGKVKCRIVYHDEIKRINFQHYLQRSIHSLKIVTCENIEYSYKYEDRSVLDQLSEFRGTADDILIVKSGMITDVSYGNIVFYHKNKWFTPSNPLLKGTRREDYLRSGKIQSLSITLENLKEFSEAKIINSMLSIEESSTIPVKNIC